MSANVRLKLPLSNAPTKKQKPHTEIYLRAMFTSSDNVYLES